MSRKYVKRIINENFVYPNDQVSEYDIEIVHDINDNSVSGTVTNFVATYNSPNIDVQFDYTWDLNGAEPWVNEAGNQPILSVHMMTEQVLYFKPWRMVENVIVSSGTTTNSGTVSFSVTPYDFQESFTTGEYFFEIRFIGHRAVYVVCQQERVTAGPVVTPTPTSTPTPTTTATPTPTFTGCTCWTYDVTADAFNEGQITVTWTDCEGIYRSVNLNPDEGIGFCACQGTLDIRGGLYILDDLGPCAPPVTPTPTATPSELYPYIYQVENCDNPLDVLVVGSTVFIPTSKVVRLSIIDGCFSVLGPTTGTVDDYVISTFLDCGTCPR